jgi:hypothetical protein
MTERISGPQEDSIRRKKIPDSNAFFRLLQVWGALEDKNPLFFEPGRCLLDPLTKLLQLELD